MTIPTPLPRIARYEKLGFGLFLHYGLYSLSGQGEWVQSFKKIPIDEYARLADSFTAEDFDAQAIALVAKEAGMRYACLTTRHHDGFSLYDTRGLNTFDALHTPCGRDLVREFVEACRREGVIPFLYHTTLDWRWQSETCSEDDFRTYLDYLNSSVEILCTQYGEIGGFWFDGNWSRTDVDWDEDRLYSMIRKHQPEAIIINNTGLHHRGQSGHPEIDIATFEQGLPSAPDRQGMPKYLAGEMSETLNAHWGVGANDCNFKSPATIIEHLCACRKVGANYLLNVGPTAGGGLGEYETALLRLVGKWIRATGQFIYEARPFQAGCSGADFILEGEGRLYYFAHGLQQDGNANVVAGDVSRSGPRTVTGLGRKIIEARWTDDGTPLRFVQSDDGSLLTLVCNGFDYGTHLVVRIAELLPQQQQ
jgi:alpha-L-fucosidase